ncbi:site-specific integrase [uncultured Sphingomonas sp.]|uniref:tyrosine-type recombinase/integrase n=1 Tax=uncultured Sphingomonas sp. TaxID=158754 RepID=UPI0025F473DB|nr:site-specific integrase [uncultured Sphingomonas sp.]
MARPIHQLTARQVSTLKAPGRHSDGGGLYLRVTPKGARSWIFMTAANGARSEIGLGAASAVSLASARRLAAEMREAVALGRDPRTVLTSQASAIKTVPTFGSFANDYIASVEAGWRNSVHRQQWRNSLRDHAARLQDKLVDDITTDDVITLLQPIWLVKPETAKRVRGRIEKILDAAKARGLRPRDSSNPAAWRGHLQLLLPAQSKLTRGHHAALPWTETPAFMQALRQRPALSARCLELTILTAARSGEALGATWGEIDLEKQQWTVPADRMKAGVQHVVPLSNSAIQLLTRLKSDNAPRADQPVFAIAGARRSNMAMAMLLRRMGHGDVTVHGFRSTFRDWAGDATDFPRELVEQALAHTISNKVERAYRRGTAVDRRRALMDAWANYLLDSEAGGDGGRG